MEQGQLSKCEVGDAIPLPWEREDVCEELGCRLEEQARWLVPSRRRVIDAQADWLQTFPLSVFVTMTWSDQAVIARRIYTDRAAVKDIKRFLREVGYQGQYFGVIEDHMHRDAPHAHLLMQDCCSWQRLWFEWKRTRGFFRSVPAEGGAFWYVAKYMLKDGRCAERVFERLQVAT